MRWDHAKRACALIVAGLMLAGCSSSDKKTAGEERTASAVTGLKETRAELVAGRTQVDKTVASMNAMRDNQGNLQTEFTAFNNELKNMDARAEKARARAKDMKARASQYQAKWREEMGKVEDPTLRAAATARANKVRERYDGITAKANEARAAYDPFMKQLRSVQTYLSNDLTPQAVQSAASVFDKAAADAKTVNAKIDAVIAELDDVATSMTPAAGASAAQK